MYRITVKGTSYTMPNDTDNKYNICMLAFMQGYNDDFYNIEKAIDYLKSIGFKIEEE